MQLARWRNVSSLKTHVIPSVTRFSAFHSTPCSCQRWKNKFNSDIKKGQQPSKNHIKYITRQKRADAKKALNSLLYNSGCSKFSFEDKYGDQGRYSNKVNQSLVSGLVENHKRKLNEKSEEKVSRRTLMAILSKYSRQHLVTNGIPGPLAIGAVLLLNIPQLGLNGGNIQIGQTSGKMKVMLSMTMMTHVM
ncbi:hypothetical protein E2542_SST02627 [Spatholobus suberectus]|nr:hypothetical protein E2542_SST02627 [Spatholobus suberectus]